MKQPLLKGEALCKTTLSNGSSKAPTPTNKKAPSGRKLSAQLTEGECATKVLPLFQNERTVSCFAGSSTRSRGSPLSEGAKDDIALSKAGG